MWSFGLRKRLGTVGDSVADGEAMRFTERLEAAILGLDVPRCAFDQAIRKSDHVDELRRVLGVLLDVLADWEQIAERSG